MHKLKVGDILKVPGHDYRESMIIEITGFEEQAFTNIDTDEVSTHEWAHYIVLYSFYDSLYPEFQIEMIGDEGGFGIGSHYHRDCQYYKQALTPLFKVMNPDFGVKNEA